MNFIDFTKIGGYRLKQNSLSKMQESYFYILKTLVGFLDLPNTGNFIVYGCDVVGANITPGMMYIDGELCPFSGNTGTSATKIKKLVTISGLLFKNGNNENVFRQTTAVIDASGTALSAFTRVNPIPVIDPNTVIDADYVHTDLNFTQLLYDHLMSIEEGAEVNVQPDWNVTNPASDAFIKNKPNIFPYIYRGETLIGLVQWSSDNGVSYVINFPDINTTDYLVQAWFFDAAGTRYVWPYKVNNVQDDQFTIRIYPGLTHDSNILVIQNVSLVYYIFPKL